MRFRVALALAAVILTAILVLGAWLVAKGGLLGREAAGPPNYPSPDLWDPTHTVPEVTVNGVTLAGKVTEFGPDSPDHGIYVEFWLLVRDPALQDYIVNRLTGVSLHTRDTEYTLLGAGALLAGGGIHFGGASFGEYNYFDSHPYVSGRNKEIAFSIQAIELARSDGRVPQNISGPWETVVAVRSDLLGAYGSYRIGSGPWGQSQHGVTVQLSKTRGSLGNIQAYEVIRKDVPPKFMPVRFDRDGVSLIDVQYYERWLKSAEAAAKGLEHFADSGGKGSQTGNATVQVGSASIPQGQQAQVAVTVKGVNDPDGLGAYDFKITYNPAVINVVSVSGGQVPFSGTPTQKVTNTTGLVAFTTTHGSIPGPTGDVIVAYVTLQAVGALGSSTVLDIKITTLAETANGDDIPAVDQDGSVTIVP